MNAKKRLDYKWVIVGCCFLMIFGVLGLACGNRGLYLSAITEALGIKRGLFSISDSLRYIATSLTSLIFGILVNKLGARKLISIGFVFLLISIVLNIFAEGIALFYASGIFLGIGLGTTGTTMVGYVINRWCNKNKGSIMGAVLCANGIGIAVGAQFLTPIIYEEGNPFGYRNAYKLCALILIVVGVIVITLFRDSPSFLVAEDRKKTKVPAWKGLTFAEAVRRPYFYGAVLCVFLTGAALQGVTGISSAHFKDVGIDTAFIATTVSVHALVLTGSKFLIGFLHDKFGLRATMSFCYIAAVIAYIALALATPSAEGKVSAMIYSVFAALALPLETIMIPLITGDIFGQVSYAQMLGILMAVNTAGYAVGAAGVNLAFDVFGSYTPILYTIAALFFVVLLTFMLILRTVDKEKSLAKQAGDKQLV